MKLTLHLREVWKGTKLPLSTTANTNFSFKPVTVWPESTGMKTCQSGEIVLARQEGDFLIPSHVWGETVRVLLCKRGSSVWLLTLSRVQVGTDGSAHRLNDSPVVIYPAGLRLAAVISFHVRSETGGQVTSTVNISCGNFETCPVTVYTASTIQRKPLPTSRYLTAWTCSCLLCYTKSCKSTVLNCGTSSAGCWALGAFRNAGLFAMQMN